MRRAVSRGSSADRNAPDSRDGGGFVVRELRAPLITGKKSFSLGQENTAWVSGHH